MAATRLESRPPERKTPTGTSPIIWRSTAPISSVRVRGALGLARRRLGAKILVGRRPRRRSGRGPPPASSSGRAGTSRPAAPARGRTTRSPRRSRTAVLGVARPVERLDADRVARGEERAVGRGGDEREHALRARPAPPGRAGRSGAARPRCRSSCRTARRRASRARPRGCRPRRCRRARPRRRASGWCPPSTSTIDSRRWPSQACVELHSPSSSGPRWTSRRAAGAARPGPAAVHRGDAAHRGAAIAARERRRQVGQEIREVPSIGNERSWRGRSPRWDGRRARATTRRASMGDRQCRRRAPVEASTRPSGSTTLAWPGKRRRPKRPVWFGRHPDDLVLDRAGPVEEVEVLTWRSSRAHRARGAAGRRARRPARR